MSFLERLRREIEDSDRAKEATRISEITRAGELEKQRLQREQAEREFHQQRREQARVFREENGVRKLAVELCEILMSVNHNNRLWLTPSGTSAEDAFFVDRVGHWSPEDSLHSIIEISPLNPKDPDSILDKVFWDRVYLGSHFESNHVFPGGSDSMGGSISSLVQEKYLVIETCPDGTIEFHASHLDSRPRIALGPIIISSGAEGRNGSTTVSESDWRKSPHVLEVALEKAYMAPLSRNFRR